MGSALSKPLDQDSIGYDPLLTGNTTTGTVHLTPGSIELTGDYGWDRGLDDSETIGELRVTFTAGDRAS